MDSGKSFAPLLHAGRVKSQSRVAKHVALHLNFENEKQPDSS